MQNLMVQNKNQITSLELVEQINFFRSQEDNRSELQHKDLLKVIRDEFEDEIGEGKISLGSYKDKQNQERPMFELTPSQAKQVLVRESKFVRKAVIHYLEELESKLKKPLSSAQQLLMQAQYLVEMENRVAEVEKDVKRLENNQRRTITSNQLTVIAYANMKSIKPKHYNSSVMGKKATKICKTEGLMIGKVVDSKYGLINTYPESVLDRIILGEDIK